MTAKTKQGDMGRVENHIKDKIGSIPITEIRRKDHLKSIIDRLSNRQAYTQAKRVAGLIERIFAFAIDAGYIQGTPADHLSRLVPKQPAGTAKHHPARTDKAEAADMLRRLWQYLGSGRSGPSMVSAMTLIAYLPVRVENMISAKWSHVDLEKKLWTFPRTKNGRAYTVPLSLQMVNVFEKQALFRRGRYCFPSGSKSGHISNAGLDKVLRAAGIPR